MPHLTPFGVWNNFLAPEADRLHRILAEVLHQTEQLLNTNLVVLLHFLNAMGCDATALCQGFLAALGGIGIAENSSGCSEYANDLPVIVDQDSNNYGPFFVANCLDIQIPIFENTSPSPATAADLKISATVYLAGIGSAVILHSIPANAAGDLDL